MIQYFIICVLLSSVERDLNTAEIKIKQPRTNFSVSKFMGSGEGVEKEKEEEEEEQDPHPLSAPLRGRA
jgi:hypothetical protein